MMKRQYEFALALTAFALLLPASGTGAAQTAKAGPAPAPAAPSQIAVSGDIVPVHDPEMIKDKGTYYLFTTGNRHDATGLMPMRTSTDLKHWTWRGPMFRDIPAWAKREIPGTGGLWAPHMIRSHGEYRLYYSVSTFGKNRSAIGLRMTRRLNPAAPASGWTDLGPVMESHPGDDFNAIDPAVFADAKGRQWMAFGSFWSGIKMVEIDPATGKRLASNPRIYSLARQPKPGDIEGAFVIRHGAHYYLFASLGFCCRGANSTYRTVVGRSDRPTGPYVDRAGKPMMKGGGTLILSSGREEKNSRFVGRGHISILHDKGQDYIVYHAYDTRNKGAPNLRIRRISWTPDGWPTAN